MAPTYEILSELKTVLEAGKPLAIAGQ